MGAVNELGPTGRYPNGKLGTDDEGELNIGLAIAPNKRAVILHFGTAVSWIALDAKTARRLGEGLIDRSNKLVDADQN
jgi:hypothetical protein